MKPAISIGRPIVVASVILLAGVAGCLDSLDGKDGKSRRYSVRPDEGGLANANALETKTVAGIGNPEAKPFQTLPTITDAQVTLEEQVLDDIRRLRGTFTKAGEGTPLKMRPHRPVISVDLQGIDELSDNDVSSLTGLYQLASLQLNNTKIGDEGVAHLGKIQSLEVLQLEGTRITDSGLAALSGLSKLRELNLSGTKVTGRGLAHLKELPTLQKLDLNGTLIGNAGLAVLAEFQDLRDVNVGRDPARRQRDDTRDTDYHVRGPNLITNAGLRVFAGIPRLKHLCVSGGGITDDGLPHLEELWQLKTLTFAGTFVTEEGANRLKEHLGECAISLTQKRDPLKANKR